MLQNLQVEISRKQEDFFIKEFIKHINSQEKQKSEKVENSIKSTGNFLKTSEDYTSFEKTDKKVSDFRIKSILQRTRKKLNLQTKTKEMKFSEKMKPFFELDSFIDIRSFLHDMNLTNKNEIDEAFRKIKNRLRKDPKGSYYLDEEEKIVFSEENGEDLLEFKLDEKKSLQNSFQLTEDIIEKFKDRILKLKQISFGKAPFIGKNSLDVKIADYLLEEENASKKSKETNFDEKLLDKIRNHDLFEESEQKKYIEIDQKSINREMKFIENFLAKNKQENFFKKEVCKGIYLKEFKNQAEKIRYLLARASKNIYHKKFNTVGNPYMRKNENLSNLFSPPKDKSPNAKSPNNSSYNFTKKRNSLFSNTIKRNNNDLKVSFEEIIEPFITLNLSKANKFKRNSISFKKINDSSERTESYSDLKNLKKKLPIHSLIETEKVIDEKEINSKKIRKNLFEMKHVFFPKLLHDINYCDKTNVKKFIQVERNHNENERMKKIMNQFLEKIEKNLMKNHLEKKEYDHECDRIFKEREINYEKIFPKALDGMKFEKNDFNKQIKTYHYKKNLNIKSKKNIF